MQTQKEIILGLLRLMNTDQVSSAEDKLMSMVQGVEFLDSMFEIVKNTQLESWVKTLAASFMNKVMSQKLQQFGYKSMFMAMSRIMTSYEVSSSDKRCFQSSIISLIEYIKEPQEIEEWRQFVLSHVNDHKLFDTALLLIDCTAIAEIQTDYLCMIIEDTFQLTLSMCETVSLQNALICNQLVKCWIVVIDKLTAIENQQNVDILMVKISTSRTLAKLMFKIFEFNAPQQIWLCVNHQLYELNLLKYEAAQLTKKVSQYVLHNSIPTDQCHCIQLIVQSYQKIKNTIAIVGNSTNLEVMEMYQCEDFITSLISLLIIYVKSLDNKTVLEEEMNILQHIVCYPFIKSRQQELYTFEESAEQFNTLAEDMCDKQTFGILKTQAARLLQTIADHSKTSVQKSIIFCIECIKMSIGYIPKYQSNEIKILDLQTAFQILTIYSFSLENYPAQLEKLKVILCDKRMMELQAMTLARIFMFLAYNYGQVFRNPQDGAFWIEFALNYNKHPTSRYMGLDFISNVVDEYFTENLYTQIIQLILSCKSKQSGLVWNIVGKLFSSQREHISQENGLLLVNTVFKRIEMEFHLLQTKQKQSSQDVINAIHVLRKIVQDKEYLLNKQSLKSRILDITVIYSKTLVLDLDDEVIKILTEYANNYLSLAKQKILTLLNPMLEQFKKDQYYQNSYFILFNQLIVGFKYQEIKPIIKTLLSGMMFHLFDMSENAKKRKMKLAIANILTLLQNLLSVHGYEMSGSHDDCMCEIGAMCIRLFPSQENQKIFSKPLLAKALNLMFICHLYSKTQNTVQYLFRYSKQNIFQGYDAFMLVKLLSKAIFAQENVQIVIEYLNLMIEVANQYEKSDKKTRSVKTASGKLKLKRQQELSNLLFQITSPFITFEYTKTKKQLPIKQQIIECITKMKSNNMDTYKLIIMNMNQQQKSKLTSMLNQKAQVQGKNRVIRKVVGAKTTSNEQINTNNQNSDMEENQDDNSANFKRKRVLVKKAQSKKNRNENNINAQ